MKMLIAKKGFAAAVAAVGSCVIGHAAFAAELQLDTADPMFFNGQWDILSSSTARIGNKYMSLGQMASVGFNDRFLAWADLEYRWDFHSPADGFDGLGLGVAYRTGFPGVTTDILAGIKFSGSDKVPEFAENRYMVGARIGKQWDSLTLAGTIKNTWIFSEPYGMAYMNIRPEVYFRLPMDWSVGAHMDFRKSTTPSFDREWIGAKVSKRFGRTMYSVGTQYEFEQKDWSGFFNLNILF